jgi:hypothetical protein
MLLFALQSTAASPETGATPDPGWAALTIATNFEMGSVGRIERPGEWELRAHVIGQVNESNRNRQANWYFFRIDGARPRELTLHLTDFVGEYNFRPGAVAMNSDTIPVFSEDGEHWQQFASMTWDDQSKEATLHLPPGSTPIWVAHVPPYPLARLQHLLTELRQSPVARVDVIGRSVQGRELHLVTISESSAGASPRKCIWVIARQHTWETGTSFVLEGAVKFLVSDDETARALRRRVTFCFVPTMDPDGLVEGHVRFNSLGYDLNRHWTEVDPNREDARSRMPEIWSVKRALFAQLDRGQPIDFLLNLHNTESNEYLETQSTDEAMKARLDRLQDELVKKSTFDPSRRPSVSSSPADTTNSLWTERRLPAAVMEQRIGTNHKLQRHLTTADRLAFGQALVTELASLVLSDAGNPP